MTMLNRRRRSSADKAGAVDQADTDPKETRQIDKDQVDAKQADTGQADTGQADDAVREDAEQAEAETERAETEEASADGGEVSTPSRGGHRRPRVRVRVGLPLLIGLTALAVLLGAGASVLWINGAELSATEDGSRQAVHAASQAARDLSSYDYRTLESDFKTASNQTTGSLHDEYDALAQQIRATAVQQQAVSQTVVIKAGVQSAGATPDQVKVLVYANRSATTTASPNRLPEPLRILMTMVKVSGRWLAKDLQVL